MRSILAGAVGLSLGLGGMAYAQQPAAGLGRPVPAASLGRPTALHTADGQQPFQTTGYRAERPAPTVPVDSAPLLAPVTNAADDARPMPLPSTGTPGSTAIPPPGTAPGAPGNPFYGPMTGPTYGPVGGSPAGSTGCASCNGGTTGGAFMGDPNAGSAFGGYNGGDPGSRFYTSFDFLMLWVPDITTPVPLAQAAPGPFLPGAPFPAGTVTVIGQSDLISQIRLGARIGAGMWFDPCHRMGLDGSFFFAGPTSRDLAATPPPGGSLWRPYTVINLPGPGVPNPPATTPNFADIVTGAITTHTDSFLMGGDINLRRTAFCNCGNFVDVLLGFRYMHLDESLTVTETSPNPAGGAAFALSDRFRTLNNFYGVQIGTIVHKQWGNWSADLLLKAAGGETNSVVEATGSNNFGGGVPSNLGLFVNTSNAGRYTSTATSVVPEVGLTLGYNITPRMRVHIGYTAMYWSNVLRPGEQIDPIIDQTKVPFPPGVVAPVFQPLSPADPHPVLHFHRSDYWAHGLMVGVDFKW